MAKIYTSISVSILIFDIEKKNPPLAIITYYDSSCPRKSFPPFPPLCAGLPTSLHPLVSCSLSFFSLRLQSSGE